MRIALAQMNAHLGDFVGNRKKIFQLVKAAKEKRADLVVFPEASLFGYHPMDLLERPEAVQDQLRELKKLEKQIPGGIRVLVGAITENTYKTGKPYFNSAVLLASGRKSKVFPKHLLPAYDVFDEGRHIEPGKLMEKNIFSFKGKKILVTVCEDIWGWDGEKPGYSKYRTNPLKFVKPSHVDLVVNLSASPFTDIKMQNRREVTLRTAKNFEAPLVYVNMVGAQDELIFDGGSFAIDKRGKRLAQSVQFQEDLNIVDLLTGEGGIRELDASVHEQRRQALVLGLRDFATKTGFASFHVGSSGGVDSAVTTCLAVDALGPQNVTTIALPGPFNSNLSLTLAKKLAENLGVDFMEIPIGDIYTSMKKSFDKVTGHKGFDLVNENMQARIRGSLLMAYSNMQNSMLLATSNKSELAMGYSTLYGDMNGGLMPLGDLLKSEVFDLARHYNKEYELIPEKIITRPPTAELAPNQRDIDSLPPYEKLDLIVERFVEGSSSPRGALDKRVMKALLLSEFKRWQSPPVLKVSEHAFGMGRRLPIAHVALRRKL